MLIGPWRYVKQGRFNAERYWHDRYQKYGTTLRGAVDEGLSEAENVASKQDDARVVLELCRREGIDLGNASVLDVGCGNGFFAGFLRDLGVKRYVGVDLTDVLFPRLREAYPDFQFHKVNIVESPVSGEYDLVLMLYVINHIMEEELLSQAMHHVRQCLSDRGVLILLPLHHVDKRRFFYLRTWSLDEVKKRFPDYRMSVPAPYRDGYAVAIRRA
jgi:SAM-dependent methyltransferase